MKANESFKQKLLRRFYPTILKLGKKGKNGIVLTNNRNIDSPTSFYSLTARLNNGKALELAQLKGKKTLLVNTASECGYTGQYAELQRLHETHGDKLNIIAFPANDFAGQEKGSDQQIAEFCQLNYCVSFPLAHKGGVIKNSAQQEIFQWLTDPSQNGWNDHAPDWNFSKYLIDENGKLTHYFGPSISPLDPEFLDKIK